MHIQQPEEIGCWHGPETSLRSWGNIATFAALIEADSQNKQSITISWDQYGSAFIKEK